MCSPDPAAVMLLPFFQESKKPALCPLDHKTGLPLSVLQLLFVATHYTKGVDINKMFAKITDITDRIKGGRLISVKLAKFNLSSFSKTGTRLQPCPFCCPLCFRALCGLCNVRVFPVHYLMQYMLLCQSQLIPHVVWISLFSGFSVYIRAKYTKKSRPM